MKNRKSEGLSISNMVLIKNLYWPAKATLIRWSFIENRFLHLSHKGCFTHNCGRFARILSPFIYDLWEKRSHCRRPQHTFQLLWLNHKAYDFLGYIMIFGLNLIIFEVQNSCTFVTIFCTILRTCCNFQKTLDFRKFLVLLKILKVL